MEQLLCLVFVSPGPKCLLAISAPNVFFFKVQPTLIVSETKKVKRSPSISSYMTVFQLSPDIIWKTVIHPIPKLRNSSDGLPERPNSCIPSTLHTQGWQQKQRVRTNGHRRRQKCTPILRYAVLEKEAQERKANRQMRIHTPIQQ